MTAFSVGCREFGMSLFFLQVFLATMQFGSFASGLRLQLRQDDGPDGRGVDIEERNNAWARARDFSIKNPECGGAQYITPFAKAIADFFPRHGVSPMPFALTAVGAFRFGGNDLRINGTSILTDFDVDVLLTFQNATATHTRTVGLLSKFSLFLIRSKYVPKKRPPILDLSGHYDYAAGETDDQYVKHPNPRKTENPFFPYHTRSPARHYFVHVPLASGVPELAQAAHFYTDKWHRDKGTKLSQALFYTFTKYHMSLDFWVEIDGPLFKRSHVEESPRQVLFAGAPFVLEGAERDHAHVMQQAICSNWGRNRIDVSNGLNLDDFCSTPPELCKFASPGFGGHDEAFFNYHPDDVKSAFETCTRGLHDHGFVSFIGCTYHDNAVSDKSHSRRARSDAEGGEECEGRWDKVGSDNSYSRQARSARPNAEGGKECEGGWDMLNEEDAALLSTL